MLLTNIVWSQTDVAFWFAAPEVSASTANFDVPIVLRITTYDQPADVTVVQPAGGGMPDQFVSIAANSTQSLDLSAWLGNIENTLPDVVLNRGLFIQSTAQITVYYEVVSSQCQCNPEIFVLKGSNALGQDFYIPMQSTMDNNSTYFPTPFSSFDIVATEDNTLVEITPAAAIVGHPANSTYTITLNQGETYSAVATSGLGANHLMGSRVVSDKDIAITYKDDLLTGSMYGPCADLGGDQIVPVEILGTEYIAINGFLNNQGDQLFIMAVEDNTDVFFNGVFLVTLNAGESFATYIGGASAYIESSAPVSVLQASGYGCEVGLDVIPPIVCTGSGEISFTRSTTESLSANLLVQSGSEGDFLFNGNAGVITAAIFSPVPGTAGSWLFAQVTFNLAQTPLGAASLISNSSGYFHMGFIHGSFSSGCRFGYFSNFSNLEVQAEVADDEVCQGESIALSCNSINGGTYAWSGPAGFSSSEQSPTINTALPAMSGEYIVMLSASSCESDYDTLIIEVHPIYAVQQDTSICFGDVLGLPDGVVVNQPGTYESTLQSSSGCDSVITTVLTFYPTNYTISSDTAICKGTEAQLQIVGGASYVWAPAQGLSSTSIANPLASPMTATTYDVDITFISGCTVQESITVSVFELPFTVDRLNPLCTSMGSLEVLASAGLAPYNYYIDGNPEPDLLIDDLSAGVYELEIVDANQCVGDTLITLTIENYTPDFQVLVEPMLCETPGTVTVVPGSNGTAPFEAALDGQLESELMIEDVVAGTYVVELTDANGCSASTTVVVEQLSPAALIIDAFPVVGRPPLSVDFENNSFNLQEFIWNFGDGVISTEFAPDHVFELPGSYQVQVFGTDSVNGCTDSQSFTVLVRPPFSVYVPNAFSPNSDNVNDFFVPLGDGFDVESYSLTIFNRWGDVVFETTNPTQPWTGNVKGSNHFAADGVYFWILRIKPDESAEMLEYEGAVNLFR